MRHEGTVSAKGFRIKLLGGKVVLWKLGGQQDVGVLRGWPDFAVF